MSAPSSAADPIWSEQGVPTCRSGSVALLARSARQCLCALPTAHTPILVPGRKPLVSGGPRQSQIGDTSWLRTLGKREAQSAAVARSGDFVSRPQRCRFHLGRTRTSFDRSRVFGPAISDIPEVSGPSEQNRNEALAESTTRIQVPLPRAVPAEIAIKALEICWSFGKLQ